MIEHNRRWWSVLLPGTGGDIRVLMAALLVVASCSTEAAQAMFPFFEPLKPARKVQLMVHRGEANQAPENTRVALERCVEDGIEWAEIDLRLTSDGKYILSHDKEIVDANGKPWPVAQHTLEELEKLDVGSAFATRYASERPLSFERCLALAKGRLNLYLDCKAVNPDSLAKEIVAAGMERQVVLYDSLASLQRAAAAVSPVKLALMTKWKPEFGLGDWAVTNGLAAVEIDAPVVTAEICRSFHEQGIRVEVKALGEWDTDARWQAAIAAGADFIQTDLPEEVLALSLRELIKAQPVRFSLHRGANRYAPENTVPAFEKSIRLGADFVEFDVRTTKDGKFYLLHDGRLDRTTDGKGPIAEADSGTVAGLSAGVKFGKPFSGVKVPTLDDFLTVTAGRVGLYFDAKAIPPEALASAVAKHGMAERTVVYQSASYLARLRAIDPRIRGLAPVGEAKELDKLVAGLKPYAIDSEWEILSKDFIEKCHLAGIRVFSDSLGRHERVEDYLKAIEWGIDLIQTDHPLRLFRAFELRAASGAGPTTLR